MERLSRFTIPGIMFITLLWYWIYSLSGEKPLLNSSNEILTVIAAVLSTPIIGLIVTSFFHTFIHLPFKKHGKPGPYWLYLPKTIDPVIFDKLSDSQQPSNSEEWASFYRKYQLKYRTQDHDKVIEFTAHRWTYFFVLINSAWVIFLSFGIGWIYVWLYLCVKINWSLFYCGLILSVLFIITAWYLSRFSLNDAREVEHACVKEALLKVKTNRQKPTIVAGLRYLYLQKKPQRNT